MIYKYTSIKNLIEGVYRDYAHQEELDLWDIIEWAGEALEFIGAHNQYKLYLADLEVKSHRAALPCNFHSLESISVNGFPLKLTSGTIGPVDSNGASENFLKGKSVDEDNFPLLDDSISAQAEYYINDGYIVTSFGEDTILMCYKGIAVDKEGYPEIPDNIYYTKAVQNYIQMMLDRQDWRRGRLPEAVYRDSQRNWEKFCVGARGAANMPNLDKAESIKNQWVRLKPNHNSADSFYNDLNVRETFKHKNTGGYQ